MDGQPQAVIHPSLGIDFASVDAHDWEDERLFAAMEEHANVPMDLEKGPILRLRLFRGKDQTTWMTTIHHIAVDMASMVLLMEDVKLLFACQLAGQPIPAWTPPSYERFAAWQRDFVESEEGMRQKEFWRSLLSGVERLRLPTDYPHQPSQLAIAAMNKVSIRRSLAIEIERLAKEQKTTLYVVLLSAFQVLLGKYCGQEKFVLGSMASGRTQSTFQNGIGMYANAIAIPADLSDQPTFAQYLQRNRQTLASILSNQDYPYALVVEQLAQQSDAGRAPFLSTAFLLQTHQRLSVESIHPHEDESKSQRANHRSFAGFDVEVLAVRPRHAKFDLYLELFQGNDELGGMLHYDSNLFDPRTIEVLIDSFVALLESIVADPHEQIHRLDAIGPRSKAILQSEALHRTSDVPSFVTAYREQVKTNPNGIAIREKGAAWTYRQLSEESDAIRLQLERAQFEESSVVAYYLPRSKEAVAVMLACWQSGYTSVSLDPSFPKARLRYILEDARPKVIATHSKYRGEISELLSEKFAMEQEIQVFWMDDQALDTNIGERRNRLPNVVATVDTDRPAYLVYTSGSTGRPKGVAVPHRGLNNIWSALRDTMKVTPRDRVYQTVSFGFDVSIGDITCALGGGAELVLAESSQIAGHELWDALATTESTIAFLSPSVLATLPKLPLPRLRFLLVGAEECGRQLVEDWSHGREMVNAYGPSETSVWVTLHPCLPDRRKPAIGQPIPNVQIHLLDRHLQRLPVGALGEICVGGTSVALGYLNQPERTAEKFVADPYASNRDAANKHATLYRTGDIGRLRHDGTLEFHGRIDQQIKLRGMRIELEEIEHCLLQASAVRQVAVVAGAKYQDQIAAFYVEQEAGAADLNHMLERCRAELPPYMVPRWLIPVESIPTNANGKEDGAELHRLWKQHVASGDYAERIAPRNELEWQVAKAFSEVLGRDQVSVHDSFFDLGGHSLLAAELASKLRPLAPNPVPLHSLLSNPTVAGIASALGGSHATSKSVEFQLAEEARLDVAIRPSGTPYVHSNPRKILLTGATGFVGAHLLRGLLEKTNADIHCLVRADSVEAGLDRIVQKCQKLGVDIEDVDRIRPELGDLAQAWLGLGEPRFSALSQEIDVIYHNGALVNFALPYHQMRAANVESTKTILRLACLHKTKPVHYVSTLSVFAPFSLHEEIVYHESDPLASYQYLLDGYSQTKWVADKLVKEAGLRGLPYTIHRPGRITGDSQTGLGDSEDLLWNAIRQCVLIGAVPAIDDTIEMTPVDYVSDAIVKVGLTPSSWNKTYHLVNPVSFPWKRLTSLLRERGADVQELPFGEWKRRMELMSQDRTVVNLLAMFPDELFPMESKLPFSKTNYGSERTREDLARLGVHCAPADDRLVRLYLDHLVSWQTV